MSDDTSSIGNVPLAPYPPLVSTRIEKGRERSRSISQITKSFAAISSPIGSTSSSNLAGNPPKRQLTARVEFYDSTVYGAINCQGHNTLDPIIGNDYENRSSNLRSLQATNTLSRVNKLGPVLLELRCLHPRRIEEKKVNEGKGRDDDSDENEDAKDSSSSQQTKKSSSVYSFYEGKTVAVSRGNASLGIGVSSTSLSFRKGGDFHPLSSSDDNYNNLDEEKVLCATGLSSGALCIHTLRNIEEYARIQMEEEEEEEEEEENNDQIPRQRTILDSANSDDASVAYFFHHQPRHNRSASAVAWRWGSRGSNSSHVAIGYNPSSGDRFASGKRSPSPMQSHGGFSGKGEYGALVWDVETQSAPAKGEKRVPTHKLAHNSSVTSLNWISDGQLLAIGCQHRNLQIYDLISAGPISVFAAHERSVNGIEVDPHNSNIFATFSRGLAEPVKLWDRRKADSCVAEIKTHGARTGGDGKELQTVVSGIAWENSSEGILSIAKGDELRSYNTRINSSRPILSHVTHSDGPLQCISFRSKGKSLVKKKASDDTIPQRILAVYTDGTVTDLPTRQVSPVALSNREAKIANALGSKLFIGSFTQGRPSTTEKSTYKPFEDISTTMMRRARYLHNNRYSTDAASNLRMLASEKEAFLMAKGDDVGSNHELTQLRFLENLYLLWSWIERIENLCFVTGTGIDSGIVDERFWIDKTLHTGVLQLLGLDQAGNDKISAFDDTVSKSQVFNRNVYDSSFRRAALTACGWTGKYRLDDVLFDAESSGHFERSAALACWHGELGEAVAALQRGAEHIRTQLAQHTETKNYGLFTSQYAETLELVAMCVAGYNSDSEKDSPSAIVWRNACKNLLNRPNLTQTRNLGSRSQLNYLRAICSFLIDDNDLDKTLRNTSLNLSDRVAFACIYLTRKQLREYLESCVENCLRNGNLEGLLITGLGRKGIALLQSYVDCSSDVQTAALVSSRAKLGPDWKKERNVCIEWLSSYREFLNKNQMWKSRAIFDVGRAELLRKLRDHKQQTAEQQSVQNTPTIGRVQVLRKSANHVRKQQHTQMTSRQNENPITSFPPQIYARCNFCNTPLPLAKLRRQENIANNWLSRQKPVLPCCPNPVCRKPLPQCAICLLPLNCLNPFMELRREGNRLNRGGQQRGGEDLSGLASMPFAEWFTWCAKCNHGGHAHHFVSWFDNHDVCPVSNCDCRCQFDTIRKFK